MCPGLLTDWSGAFSKPGRMFSRLQCSYIWLGFFFFFNANDFHLWNKITTNYGLRSFKSEESRLEKEVILQQAHTALHLCGLKIKLSTPLPMYDNIL